MLKTDKYSVYAVLDGHGEKGHDVSQFVKETLPKYILMECRLGVDLTEDSIDYGDPLQCRHRGLRDSFKKTQSVLSVVDRMKKLSVESSGTTCSVCVHDHKLNTLTWAHIGDSAMVLGTNSGGTLRVDAFTENHRPEMKMEKERIEKGGGRVCFDGFANHRVYDKHSHTPGLRVSRCLGYLLGLGTGGSKRKAAPSSTILQRF